MSFRLLAVPIGLLAACQPEPSNEPGTYDDTLEVEAQQRRYLAYVPEEAAGEDPVPVVLMLHGADQDRQTFLDASSWARKADQMGFIVVFPEALTYCYKEDENDDGDYDDPGERVVASNWASGGLGDAEVRPLCTAEEVGALPATSQAMADHPLMDDIAFFRRLVDDLDARFAIDRDRIYATGFSNGGQMVARLAAEGSDLFAAGASAGGRMEVEAATAAHPMTFVLSVGADDPVFTALNGDNPLPLDESLPGLLDAPLIAKFLTTLQLEDEWVWVFATVGNTNVATFRFSQSTAGADNQFILAVIGGLQHQYPNGDNSGVDAADLLWEAFESRRLGD